MCGVRAGRNVSQPAVVLGIVCVPGESELCKREGSDHL